MQPAARGLLAAQLAGGGAMAAHSSGNAAEADSMPLLRPERTRAADSIDVDVEDEESDDQWVPVSLETVDAWREAALTGEAMRGHSLDDAATRVAALTHAASVLRLSASCGNLAAMGAPPAPFPKLPPLAVPAAPSVSSGCVRGSWRLHGRVCARGTKQRGGDVGSSRGSSLRLWARRARPNRARARRARRQGCGATTLCAQPQRAVLGLRRSATGWPPPLCPSSSAADARAPRGLLSRSGSDAGNSLDGMAKAAGARSSEGAPSSQPGGGSDGSDMRRTSSPSGWFSPKIVKRLRRTPSLSRLCGDVDVADSP
jgi:hypothetical protein